MRTQEPVAGDATLIFRYVVSSTEMRHIERAERRVYLGAATDGGLRLWGEIAGCGEACHADLAVLLLEFAMSCEGSPEPRLWLEASRTFTDQASAAMTAAIIERTPAAGEERARLALESLLWSMETSASSAPESRSGRYGFSGCPLCAAATSGGTLRVSDMAHGLFYGLCRATVRNVAPGWSVSGGDDLPGPGHPLHLSLTADDPR